jgi:hypothetical protein
LEEERGEYYNIRKVNYYLSHMDYVQDYLHPSMNIAVPVDYEDCYNFEEYMKWPIIYDIMIKQSEHMIDNPHVNKNDPLKIHPMSFIIERKEIPSFNKLPISEIPYTTKLGIFDTDDYNIEFK